MDLSIQSVKFDADRKLLDFVEKKLSKIEKFDENITSVDVTLALMEKPDNKSVKVQAHVPGGTLVIERSADTFEEAVNDAADAMKEKIVRSKEKRQG